MRATIPSSDTTVATIAALDRGRPFQNAMSEANWNVRVEPALVSARTGADKRAVGFVTTCRQFHCQIVSALQHELHERAPTSPNVGNFTLEHLLPAQTRLGCNESSPVHAQRSSVRAQMP